MPSKPLLTWPQASFPAPPPNSGPEKACMVRALEATSLAAGPSGSQPTTALAPPSVHSGVHYPLPDMPRPLFMQRLQLLCRAFCPDQGLAAPSTPQLCALLPLCSCHGGLTVCCWVLYQTMKSRRPKRTPSHISLMPSKGQPHRRCSAQRSQQTTPTSSPRPITSHPARPSLTVNS